MCAFVCVQISKCPFVHIQRCIWLSTIISILKMKISIKILTLVQAQQLFHKIYPRLHCSESQKAAIQSIIYIQEHLIIPWISLFKTTL